MKALRHVGQFWCGIFIALSAVSATCADRPNIVLILADDVGREVLGCYGGTSYPTPRIDRLAADGLRFEHFYVMPVCHPTRTTLLTGQYPFRLGHPRWGSFPRAAEERSLPNMLRRAGYATAIAGKWQLALLKEDLKQPYRMGFDEYSLYGWHEGAWYYRPFIWQNGKRRTDIDHRFGPDVICDFVVDFIQRNKDRPFFAFYSMELCHAETNDLPKPAPVGPNGRYDSYAEMVVKMDDRVGRVVDTLDRLGLRKNTLLLYLTDNGTAQRTLIDAEGDQYIYEGVVSKMGEREIPGGKATLTDWGTRVPLIISWPGKIEPGGVNQNLADVSDLLPSLADVAGAKLPNGVLLDGHSLGAEFSGNATPRKWIFAEHEGKCFVRNRRWKLYDDRRIFDMDADPDEKQPLRADDIPAEATAAYRELKQALAELNYSPPPK
ncbi:MAG TPA: sulfatase-like hydrolase/transferase [Lacipirellulaceae bacterium]|nr:sulfatase-like hydrolase/transferase [Lacipirellulaceae bacterium]